MPFLQIRQRSGRYCVLSTPISVVFVCQNTFFPSFFPHRPISSSGKYSEYKPSWPPEPIGQNKLWKTNRTSSQLPRPPPGLTNQKQASPSPWGSGGPRLARGWGGGGINQESRFGPGTVYTEIWNHLTIRLLITSVETIQMKSHISLQ